MEIGSKLSRLVFTLLIFKGAIQHLKLYGMPGVAEVHCDDSLLSFGSTDGSGDLGTDLADFYDYPSYDDEYDKEGDELGASTAPPPPPRPPPTPLDTTLEDSLSGLFGGVGNSLEPKGEAGGGGKGVVRVLPPSLIPSPKQPANPKTKSHTFWGSESRASQSHYENEPYDTGGTCACNSTEILLKLPETLRGLPGPQGEVGPPGPIGVAGPQGLQGVKGDRGERGEIGTSGPEGIQGPKGEPGLLGQPGSPGLPGPPGPAGTQSFLGLDDSLGGSGMMSRSMIGPKGDTGDTGPKGHKGERGYVGPKGERGLAGPSGERGLSGPSGVDGNPGYPGKDGGKGSKGERGEAGPPGAITSTSDLGGILNSVEPLKGEKGPAGIPGDRGLPGLPGVKGDKGDTGIAGPPGPPGSINIDFEDGYQVLKGSKGEIGRRGKRGRPGLPGPRGPAGEIGIPGWPGKQGSPGLAIQGPKGEKGEPAVLPEDFFKYEVSSGGGKPGPPGTPGVPGPPGTPGKSEYGERGPVYVPVAGPPGSKGDAGPPGPPGLSIVGEQGPMGPPGQAVPGNQGRESSSKVVPGAVVVLTRDAMLKMSELSPVGTIAFVKDEESLFARVSEGWKPIFMGELIRAEPVMSHTDLTTEAPIIRPPFEASSLINKIEGPSDMTQLRLAALNDPSSGDIHGVRGADYACYRQARNANLLGTFRAFLSSWVQNLDSIVKFSDRNLPVVNTKGDLLFNSWAEIFQSGGKFFARPPKLYSFNGRNVFQDFHWPQKMVWHGADMGGVRARQSYCEAWHSDSVSGLGLATDLLKNQLLGQEKIGCNNKLVVLCIEIASQNSYRRRRRQVSLDDANSDNIDVHDLPEGEDHKMTLSSTLLPQIYKDKGHAGVFSRWDKEKRNNLTYEEYTQFLDDYDNNNNMNASLQGV